jgi:hypothetical protein
VPALAIAPDAYEPDDNASLAKVIVVNDTTPQQHNMHTAGDEDWMKFYGLVQQPPSSPYSITVKPTGEKNQPAVELYDGKGVLLGSASIPDDTTGIITLGLNCDNDAIYYVRVKSRNPELYGDGTEYGVSVSVPMAPSEGTGVVTGMVIDAMQGTPLDSVLIRTSMNATAISQAGMYIMVHPSGMHTIFANIEGFVPFSAGFNLNAGESITRDINMVPVGAATTTIPCPAEALYGEHGPETEFLRQYRDNVLAKTPGGQRVIELYYSAGPKVVKMMEQDNQIKKNLKHSIDAIMPAINKIPAE